MSMPIVVKRDGRKKIFNKKNISDAVYAAAVATKEITASHEFTMALHLATDVAKTVTNRISNMDCDHNQITVEEIQDIVEEELMKSGRTDVAKCYILYREKRSQIRNRKSRTMQTMKELTFSDSKDNDTKRENGNIDGNTAMGLMLKYGSEVSKEFALDTLIDPEVAKAHRSGDFHIHDLDFYAMGTLTCIQHPLAETLRRGFSTGHGTLRPPKSIRSFAALACIEIQACQNDMHGGQAVNAWDYDLALGVHFSFEKALITNLQKYIIDSHTHTKFPHDLHTESIKDIVYAQRTVPDEPIQYHEVPNTEMRDMLGHIISVYKDTTGVDFNSDELMKNTILQQSIDDTINETYQAMEAAIHNLNTLHSRAGSQVPFSSINFGTDTSDAGRLVSRKTLEAIDAGMGNGETAIFPISIFKVYDGINFKPGDPNYDLYRYSMEVTARRLFPNYVFGDAPYNYKYYKPGHPETEIVAMGCRTRVIGNVNGPEIVSKRGNISFTTVNLPRLGIKHGQVSKEGLNLDEFFADLHKQLELIEKELLDRYEYQCNKKVKNFPFLMGEGLWLDSEKLGSDDDLHSVVKHGTLSIGFIGLAECLVALIGEHHAESAKAQELGLRIIKYIRDYCDDATKRTHLNFSVLATPSEGLSGRFVKIDKEIYGIIPGVTDREYYTNSMHCPVYYQMNAFDKIEIEAAYHPYCNAGHICYVELDGDVTQNIDAIEEILAWMKECGIGYGSLNHPVDYDPVCGYVGIIGDTCPRCGRKENEGVPVQKLKKLGVWREYNTRYLGYPGDINEEEDRTPNLFVTKKED